MKMLMKIALPKMGELLVMMAVTISPSRREVSPAEQLCRSPKLVSTSVPPRDGGVSSRKPPYDFFQVKTPHIREDWHRGAIGGPTRQGARPERGCAPPPSWIGGGPPSDPLSPDIFLYFLKRCPVEFRSFLSCAE